ncbi:MAG: hypothetical protein JWR80_4393 [Bradyrhizobium sp.]|nr:hypothetical protein [Bradyrhizobium sp.]
MWRLLGNSSGPSPGSGHRALVEDRTRRCHDLVPAILFEQVDRPLVREQRALLDQPEPGTTRIAGDLEDITDTLEGTAIHELFERKGVLGRADSASDELVPPIKTAEIKIRIAVRQPPGFDRMGIVNLEEKDTSRSDA